MIDRDDEQTVGQLPGFRGFLAALRQDWRSLWDQPGDRLAAQVLIASALLLIVYAIWGRPNFLAANLPAVAGWIGWGAEHEYYPALPYLYWGLSSVLIRILLPVLVIVLWIHRRPSDFGYRLRGVTSHAWLYLLMFLVMAFFNIFGEEFLFRGVLLPKMNGRQLVQILIENDIGIERTSYDLIDLTEG